MNRIPFGIVGSGWRSEFFLRIAQACPERFEVTGMVVRTAEKGRAFEERWKVKTFRSLEDLLAKTASRFVISSVPWNTNPEIMKMLAQAGMPCLSETPPAPDLPGMLELCEFLDRHKAKAQVAEQVHLRPHHQAQLVLAASGKLGPVHHAQVSVAHGYHGISVMRKLIGLVYEECSITGRAFKGKMVKGAGRYGLPEQECLADYGQDFYFFDYGEKLGLLDFTGSQYFATIRNERLLARGERGEIINEKVYYLKDFQTPLCFDMRRQETGLNGDLGPRCLAGIQCGDDWIYRNPFAPAALMDDEIAIAEVLVRMDECARTGRDFYPVAEACQDHYLYLLAQEAVKTGQPQRATRQAWAR